MDNQSAARRKTGCTALKKSARRLLNRGQTGTARQVFQSIAARLQDKNE